MSQITANHCKPPQNDRNGDAYMRPTPTPTPNPVSHPHPCIFGRPLRVMVRPILWDRCLSCLSVTLVYCGQTVGWIKMPLGTEVGLGPGDTVLYGDRAPSRKEAQQLPLFGLCLLWPNGRPSQQLLSSCIKYY